MYAWRRAFLRHEGIGGGSAELAGVAYLPPQSSGQDLLDGDELKARPTSPYRQPRQAKPSGCASLPRCDCRRKAKSKATP